MPDADWGPFETEAQARKHPAAIAAREVPSSGPWQAAHSKIIRDAAARHGVTLGAFDEQQVGWLGNWEPALCVVVAGLIERAADGPWRHWNLADHAAMAMCPACGRGVMGDGPAMGDLITAIRDHKCPAAGDDDA